MHLRVAEYFAQGPGIPAISSSSSLRPSRSSTASTPRSCPWSLLRAAVVDSWSAVAACLRGPASSLVCGRAASFDSLMRRARPTTSWTPRSDVRRCLARTRHTNVPAHAPHASRPTARLLSLCIAASAVAQRRRAAHGSLAPHAPRLSPMRRLLCPRAADLPSGLARCLARCERVPVAPWEALRRRRASLGRPGGGHWSRRGQPRRRDASVAPLWMRSCAQQRNACHIRVRKNPYTYRASTRVQYRARRCSAAVWVSPTDV